MRRYLSPAFSERSLKDQEDLITSVIDRFVERIGEHGVRSVNLTMWFNLMTFDVMGELAFGQSFGGVDSGKMNPWITVVLDSMSQATTSDALGRFPLLGLLWTKINPGWLKRLQAGSRLHEKNTLQVVEK